MGKARPEEHEMRLAMTGLGAACLPLSALVDPPSWPLVGGLNSTDLGGLVLHIEFLARRREKVVFILSYSKVWSINCLAEAVKMLLIFDVLKIFPIPFMLRHRAHIRRGGSRRGADQLQERTIRFYKLGRRKTRKQRPALLEPRMDAVGDTWLFDVGFCRWK